jgi:glucosamine 6-phosphate synthetase-like amidotransferase/phosphosugar isomerase protein
VCGIAGLILGRAHRSDRDLDSLWERFTALLTLAQQRGVEAAGAMVLCEDGELVLSKAPLPATRLIRTPQYERLRRLLPRATVVLGHARHVTKGPARHAENNHPILAGHHLGPGGLVIGVHNGRVLNDDALGVRYDVPRAGTVDSEVLFQLIAEAHRHPDCRARLRRIFEELRGPTAALWVAPAFPHRCYLARLGSPLARAYDATTRTLLVASLKRHLEEVVGDTLTGRVLSDEHLYRLDTRQPELGWPWEYSQARSYYSRISELSFDDLRAIAQARAQWTVDG